MLRLQINASSTTVLMIQRRCGSTSCSTSCVGSEMQWNAVNLAALDQIEFEGLVPHCLISLCHPCPVEPWLQCTCVALCYKYIQILHASCPTDVGIPRNVCVYRSVFLGLRCHGVIPLPYTEAATLSMYPITIQSPSNHHHWTIIIALWLFCIMLQDVATLHPRLQSSAFFPSPRRITSTFMVGWSARYGWIRHYKDKASSNLQSTSFQNAVLLSK